MKKICGALGLLFALVGCGGGDQTVTPAEFAQIQNGMTLEEVNKIIGFDGVKKSDSSVFGLPSAQGYAWKNKDDSGVMVVFMDSKVQMKIEQGLPR